MPDSARWLRVETLFADALDRPEATRAAFVRARAAPDTALADEVLGLLAHHDDAEAAWGESAADWGAPLLADADRRAGDRIGPYALEHPLGRGGMGTVWRAHRADGEYAPDAQGEAVAIKILRRGLDTADVRRRFRQERRLLAALDHDGIARLLGGGVTPDGLPYVVMEYVDGEPINAYCDRLRLGVEARLRLFRQVCEAVHHAHQRLVVHRDLKPSNILVVGEAGAPRVKLLDFGIAKVLQPDEMGLSQVFTRAEQRLFTPAYASPEQRTGDFVTTASDVYGLGVLLYELLTGHLPFPAAPPPDTAPPRLSEVVRQRRTEASGGRAHGVDDERLRGALAGDLDTIVRMALRPEPERRYASASQFGDDVERHLRGQPIAARPATARERVAGFVRRHRAGVAAVAAAGLALVAFAGAMSAERTRTAREAARARAVADVLASLFDAANPMVSNGDTATVHDVLRRAEPRVRATLAGQPEALAEVLGVIGRAYRDQTDFARADTALRDALALHRRTNPGGDATAAALGDLATLDFMRGDLGSALARARAHLALVRERHGPRDLRAVPALARIAAVHLQAHRLDSARATLDAGFALTRPIRETNPDAYLQFAGLDGWYAALTGDHAAAVRVAREILALHRRTGAALADIALAERILGEQCLRAADLACADTALASADADYRTVFGPDSRYGALVLAHRAELAAARGLTARADSLFTAATARTAAHFGPDSPEARATRDAYERHRALPLASTH